MQILFKAIIIKSVLNMLICHYEFVPRNPNLPAYDPQSGAFNLSRFGIVSGVLVPSSFSLIIEIWFPSLTTTNPSNSKV
jgi:hypothetical protein